MKHTEDGRYAPGRNEPSGPMAGRDGRMPFTLADTLDSLERTPAVLDRLLRGSSPAWHRVHEGPDTWSAFDVVGHLLQGEEADWVPRAQIILEDGDRRTFEPFDRSAHVVRFSACSLDDLLDRFAAARASNLEIVRGWGLTESQLSLPGSHPALGAVTLRQLLATWAVHDLNHIGQIVRVMAGRYAGEVGPWRAYLSILNR